MHRLTLACALLLLASPTSVALASHGPAHEGYSPPPLVWEVETIPALPGVAISFGDRTFVTDESGQTRIAVQQAAGEPPLQTDQLKERLAVADVVLGPRERGEFNRWYGGGKHLIATFRTYRLVTLAFVDLRGRPIDLSLVEEVTLKGSHGSRETLSHTGNTWLLATRIVPSALGIASKALYYTIERVEVRGSNVVNRSQQRFFPSETADVSVELLFYPLRITVRDALFRFPVGSGILLEFPDGRRERYALRDGAELTLPSLPRGDYWIAVDAPGFSFRRPLALSRPQDVRLEVISYLDLGIGASVLAALALGLVAAGRPHAVRKRLAQIPARFAGRRAASGSGE